MTKRARSDWEAVERRSVVEFGMVRCFVTEAEMRAQIERHEWPFYVYALCDPIGCVFYIGKGQKDRIFAHAIEAHRGGAGPKSETIRVLGGSLRYAILLSCLDETAALVTEATFIDGLWSAKTLTNVRRETVAGAMEAACSGPVREAWGSLRRTKEIIDKMTAQNERDIANLARRWPHMIPELYPEAGT